MEHRILVAYASKYGATAEIAGKIGEILQQAGQAVDIRLAEGVSDLTQYSAVILGSAVYAGQWRREAVNFLEKYEYELAQMPVWLFSSGPTGEGDPVQLMKGWRFPEGQRAIADRIQPRDIAVFHGVLNMQKLNWGERFLIKSLKAPVGDFRNWEDVKFWATAIAEALGELHPQP